MTIVSTGTGGGVLLERDDALAALGEALTDARLGRGHVLLVGGEAGAGKTSIVRAFCAGVPGDTRVLEGACDALSTPRPLGPFVDVAHSEPALAAAVHRGAPPPEVFGALRDGLAQQPTVLVLEDLHWADEATLDVLRLLARRVDSLPTVVIATYRDDGLTRVHPLRILTGDLATIGGVSRVPLAPLSRAAVAELALGQPVDPDDLHARTGGNPFFVSEVLAAGSHDVPATVTDAVLARTARLGSGARALLEVIALSPPRAEQWLLDAVLDTADSVDELEECLGTGVITTTGLGSSFRHELAREAIEAATPPPRRLELHRAILDALVERGGEPDLPRLAHHAEAASDGEAALRYATLAAEAAAATGANREAAAQYARALRFGADLPLGRRAALLEGRSRACYLADDQLEAIEVVREAIACRRQEGAPLQEARALTELADYLSCRGFLVDAMATVRRAEMLVAGQPEHREHAYVLNIAGRFSAFADPGESIRLAERAIVVGERHGDAYVAGHARVTAGRATARLDLEAGLSLLDQAVRFGREHGQPEVVARGLNSSGAAAAAWNRHALAERSYAAALDYCEEYTSDLWRINALAASAVSFLARARFDDASRRAIAVLDDPRESPWPHHAALIVLALVRARRGDPGARDCLAEAATVEVQPDEVEDHLERILAQCEVAWIEGRGGEIAGLTELPLREAGERDDVDAITRLAFWRRLAGTEVDVPVAAAGPYALALAGAWEDAAAEWLGQERPYEAALAQAHSDDVAVLRGAHADLLRLGAVPLASIVARRLRERGARDVPRGPRATTRANGAELTLRELEVLALVADGLRNAEVAERLVISPKTVDHHVSAILRKLGVHARGKAVAEAARRGLLQDG